MTNRRPRSIRNKGVIAAGRVRRRPSRVEPLAFRVDPWTRRVIRPLLISALSTALAIGVLVIVGIMAPGLPWLGVAALCWFAALEGAYTAAWLNNPDSHGVDRTVYRVAEILLLIVLARLYSWVLFGQGFPTPDELRLFLTAPLSLLATGGFLPTVTAALSAWWIAVSTSRTFTRLDVSIYELQFYTQSQAEQKAQAEDRPIQIAREVLLSQYLKTWLTLGMVMIVVAALSTYEVGQLATVTNPFKITRLGMRPAMLFALLTYFLSGLWLLSHARLLRMNARWLMDGVAKEPTLERGWQRSSLTLLLLIALLAAFLPIGSTLAISQLLTIGLSGVAYLASAIFSLFSGFFGAVLMALTDNTEQTPVQPITTTPVPFATPVAQPPPTADPFTTMMISSAFWALLIAIIIGSFLFFLRERGYRVDITRIQEVRAMAITWLRDLWARLAGRFRSVRRGLVFRMRDVAPRVPAHLAVSLPRPRFFRLNSLSPRDQIRYYYLSLVRRAGERGVSRRGNETPLEYVQELRDKWPEAEEDLRGLTEGFLDARYGRGPIEKNEVNPIKERWKRLKARMRGQQVAE